MTRLLQIEFQKLWKNRASKVLTITYFVLLTLISLIAAIEFDIGPIHISVADQGVFNFPFIWHFNTYVADYFKIFLAVVIVSMMANEYSYGTLKQDLIDGMSKKEFVLSKFITVVLFAFVSTVFLFKDSDVIREPIYVSGTQSRGRGVGSRGQGGGSGGGASLRRRASLAGWPAVLAARKSIVTAATCSPPSNCREVARENQQCGKRA